MRGSKIQPFLGWPFIICIIKLWLQSFFEKYSADYYHCSWGSLKYLKRCALKKIQYLIKIDEVICKRDDIHWMCLSPSCKAERHVVPVPRKEKRKSSTVLSRWCDEPQQPCYFLHIVSEQVNGTLKDHFSRQQKLTICIHPLTGHSDQQSCISGASTVLKLLREWGVNLDKNQIQAVEAQTDVATCLVFSYYISLPPICTRSCTNRLAFQRQKTRNKMNMLSWWSTNEGHVFLKQRERARTIRTATNTETTRCYIRIWCDISLPMLPICSLPCKQNGCHPLQQVLINRTNGLDSASDLIIFRQQSKEMNLVGRKVILPLGNMHTTEQAH